MVFGSGGRLDAQQGFAHAPTAIAVKADGTLLLAEYEGQRLVHLQTDGHELAVARLRGNATGLALSPDGATVAATWGGTNVTLYSADGLEAGRTMRVPLGACAPRFSADGARLFVLSQWAGDVTAFDVASGEELWRTPVLRQPVDAAVSADGGKLYVANLLPVDASNGPIVSAQISVLDTASGETRSTIRLPDGSQSVLGIAAAPNGEAVYAVHLLSRYHLPTTQLERGWMNTNAISVIDPATDTHVATVLLDDVDRGAANPWAVGVTPNSQTVVVASAGTHEVSVIDARALRAKIDQVRADFEARVADLPADARQYETDGISEDLTFLLGMRQRIDLGLNGPRALQVVAGRAFAAGYFSDQIAVVELGSGQVTLTDLRNKAPLSKYRRGEMNFADGSLCFQNWQSCLSCHPGTRADGLNWDLLNDGIGNPKNTKSMYLTFRTPPAMALGVRESIAAAVRAGVRVIQFAVRPEEDYEAIDEYLQNMPSPGSPLLVDGKLTASAQRGKVIFESDETGCLSCHSGELYTDLQQYEMGMGLGQDEGLPFDTPTLIELWRTAPYLHDGRAATIQDVLTTCNPDDRHGKTSHLSPAEIADLTEFLGSL
ncbi:MAG TPA: cell surface protein [Armatimonadetes bacterium]|nr:cell surface protein [Armatimonadota bacterium]